MLKDLVLYLGRLSQEKFCGTVRIEFMDGRVSFVRVDKIIKPEDLRSGEKGG
jgi:hypothetical protein